MLPPPFALPPGRRVVAALACLALAPFVSGQELPGAQAPEALGARSIALGGAGVALGGDAWAGGNPAAWALAGRPEVALYGDQRYLLAELSFAALRGVLPTRFGAVAVGGQTFGYDDYRVTGGTLGVARAFQLGTTRRVLVGAAVNAQSVAIPAYGSAAAVTLDAGVLTDVLPTVAVGARATNLLGSGVAGGPLPRHLAVGLAIRPDPRLAVALDLDKEVRGDLSVRAGAEVLPVPMLALRAGAAIARSDASTTTRRFGAGVGLRLASVSADLSADVHPELGISPAIGLSARF